MKVDLILTPAEYENLGESDLRGRVCVVFDILRATSSIITGLGNGVREFLPARTIEEALALHAAHPDSLLAGERGGLRIGSELTGGINFDLGNSPREYLTDEIHHKSVIITTTNGTRALRSCLGAKAILIASFLNLRATLQYIVAMSPADLLLVASGTGEETAYEDILGAGALVNLLSESWGHLVLSDAALLACRLFLLEQPDLVHAFLQSGNGRNLATHPQLREDIAFCAQMDRYPLVARMDEDGAIRAVIQVED